MIAGKFLGILIPSFIYDLDFIIDNNIDGIFSVQILFSTAETTLFINSISNLAMILLLAIPTIYYIIKTSIYQSTLQNPKTIVKMTRLNILKWITKDDTTFLQIFIWSSFLTIASTIVIIHTLQGNSYQWIGITSGVLTLFTIWGSMKTFELEIDNIYPTDKKYY